MQVVEYLADLIVLEGQVHALLGDHRGDVEDQPVVAAALDRFQQMVEDHRTALVARLSALGGTQVSDPARLMAWPVPSQLPTPTDGPGRVSGVVHAWYSAFSHLAFAYGVLHAVAHRFYDSQGEGNTAEDLAELHLRRYAGAV
jgi:hypothetical protein